MFFHTCLIKQIKFHDSISDTNAQLTGTDQGRYEWGSFTTLCCTERIPLRSQTSAFCAEQGWINIDKVFKNFIRLCKINDNPNVGFAREQMVRERV